jgi:hypothetical protein
MSVDLVFRLTTWLLTAGRAGRAVEPQRTDEQQAAALVSSVLMKRTGRYSDVVQRWPVSSANPLIAEAFELLKVCADPDQDTFDQQRLDTNLGRLSDVLNRLRM